MSNGVIVALVVFGIIIALVPFFILVAVNDVRRENRENTKKIVAAIQSLTAE